MHCCSGMAIITVFLFVNYINALGVFSCFVHLRLLFATCFFRFIFLDILINFVQNDQLLLVLNCLTIQRHCSWWLPAHHFAFKIDIHVDFKYCTWLGVCLSWPLSWVYWGCNTILFTFRKLKSQAEMHIVQSPAQSSSKFWVCSPILSHLLA